MNASAEFGFDDTSVSATLPAAAAVNGDSARYVRVVCECGFRGGNYLRHYQVCRCVCGRFYWALQPKRNGPLVAFAWEAPKAPERNLSGSAAA